MKIGEITTLQDGSRNGWIVVNGQTYNFNLVPAPADAKREYNVMAGRQELGGMFRETSKGGRAYHRLWLFDPMWPKDLSANVYDTGPGKQEIVVHPPRERAAMGEPGAPTSGEHSGSPSGGDEPPPHPGPSH